MTPQSAAPALLGTEWQFEIISGVTSLHSGVKYRSYVAAVRRGNYIEVEFLEDKSALK